MKAFRELQAKDKLHIKLIIELVNVVEKDLIPSLKLLYCTGSEMHTIEETDEMLSTHDRMI